MVLSALVWARRGEVKGRRVKEKALRMILLRNQIGLMLNPSEEDHQKLMTLLEEIRRASQESDRTEDFPKAVLSANECCKKILKDEWNRVKSEQAAQHS